MSKSQTPMTVQRAADAVGVGVETIRYYQRIGLIAEPPKPASGYRLYPESTLARLRFIQRAKELGFSLTEIASLLELEGAGCKEGMALAANKLALIEAKIADLQALAGVLTELVQACALHPEQQGCPLIDTLTQRQV